jgi:hypothetical protein
MNCGSYRGIDPQRAARSPIRLGSWIGTEPLRKSVRPDEDDRLTQCDRPAINPRRRGVVTDAKPGRAPLQAVRGQGDLRRWRPTYCTVNDWSPTVMGPMTPAHFRVCPTRSCSSTRIDRRPAGSRIHHDRGCSSGCGYIDDSRSGPFQACPVPSGQQPASTATR